MRHQEQEFEILQIDAKDAKPRIRAQGRTIQDVFTAALRALAAYAAPEAVAAARGARRHHEARIEAVDISSLLVEFLSEALAQADMRNIIFTDASFDAFGENFLETRLIGFAIDGLEREVRGVAYNETEIKKNPDTGFFEAEFALEV